MEDKKDEIKEEEKEEEEVDEEMKSIVSDLLDSKVKDIEAKFEEKLKAEKEKMRKKVGIYNDKVQEKENRKERNTIVKGVLANIAKGNYAGAESFLRTKDHSTTDPSEVVDTELAPEILALQEEYGVARQLFRNIQLSQHSYAANELATDVTAYWVDEGNDITASAISVTQNELSLDKLAAIASLTNELLEDSEVDLLGFLTERVAEAFAQAEDDQFLADSSEGLINTATDSPSYLSGTDMTAITDKTLANELADVQGEVSESVRRNGVYVMSWSIYNYIKNLQDDNGQYIFRGLRDGEMRLHGKPIVISEVLPEIADVQTADAAVLMFGDFEKGCILGYKGGIRVDRATQGVVTDAGSGDNNLFQTDRQAVRFIQRTGYIQALSNTVAVLKTATS